VLNKLSIDGHAQGFIGLYEQYRGVEAFACRRIQIRVCIHQQRGNLLEDGPLLCLGADWLDVRAECLAFQVFAVFKRSINVIGCCGDS